MEEPEIKENNSCETEAPQSVQNDAPNGGMSFAKIGLTAVVCLIFQFIALIVFAVIMFPVRNELNDGGTVRYEAVSHIYAVDDLHRMTDEEGVYTVGTVIYIYGNEVYNNSRNVYEE
jgi:hypothetical protein